MRKEIPAKVEIVCDICGVSTPMKQQGVMKLDYVPFDCSGETTYDLCDNCLQGILSHIRNEKDWAK